MAVTLITKEFFSKIRLLPLSHVSGRTVGSCCSFKSFQPSCGDRHPQTHQASMKQKNKPQVFSHQPIRSMAGHSKWQNIRHIKAAKDAEKGKNISQMLRKIRYVAREGLDPKINPKLAKALEEAKTRNVPNSSINEALKKMEKKKSSAAVHVLEGRGIGNCCLMIEVYTEKVNHSRQMITAILKKFGGSVGAAGSSSYAFDKKSFISVPSELEGKQMSQEEALEHAIEVGAEDVMETLDEEEKAIIQFVCDPADAKDVKKNLEAANMTILSNKLGYVPHTFTTIEKEQEALMRKMFDMLEDHEDVLDIYDNIQEAEA